MDAVKTRSATVSPLTDAVRTDLISHMCDIAVRLDRKITWDPKTEDDRRRFRGLAQAPSADAVAVDALSSARRRSISSRMTVQTCRRSSMNRRTCLVLALAVAFSLLPIAQVRTADGDAKLRVLLTFGGHDFQEKEFFAMWDAMPGVTYTKAPLPQSAELFKPGLEKEYDAIVCYDMVKELKPEHQQGLLALLDRGIGLVALHHNLSGNLEWAEYHKVIGGTWLWKQADDRRPRVRALDL